MPFDIYLDQVALIQTKLIDTYLSGPHQLAREPSLVRLDRERTEINSPDLVVVWVDKIADTAGVRDYCPKTLYVSPFVERDVVFQKPEREGACLNRQNLAFVTNTVGEKKRQSIDIASNIKHMVTYREQSTKNKCFAEAIVTALR